ncbi:MAG TPA: hypothetical protein VGM39_10555 [Kofleriaceae bacterium]|jgi:hypothetical protein
MAALWPRENYTLGGGPAQVALIALSSAKLPDPLPVSRKTHGMPDEGEGPTSVALVARDRAEDPTWFTESVLAPFADLIVQDLGDDAAATALAAEHAYVIEASIDDPDDLGHLQAAWALAKCVCEEGAAVVIDVYAARAHLGTDIAKLSPERAFDVMHEVTFFFEETRDTVAAWSLGLRKFGRPDLVLLDISPPLAAEAALMLRDISAALASGERIEPGDLISGGEGAQLEAAIFTQDLEPLVAVDGPALVLRRVTAKA